MMKRSPFVVFGNVELAKLPVLREGDVICCPRCKKMHKIEAGVRLSRDGTVVQERLPREKSLTLLFYSCGKKIYLAAVGGKNVTRCFPRREQVKL